MVAEFIVAKISNVELSLCQTPLNEMEAMLKKRPQVVLTNVDLLADSSVKVMMNRIWQCYTLVIFQRELCNIQAWNAFLEDFLLKN